MLDLASRTGLQVRGLTVRFGSFTAVDNISFDLAQGEITAMCGLNGCGKSSALKAVRGLIPSVGSIELFGVDLRRQNAKQIARHISMLGQEPEAPDEMAIHDLVALGRYAHRSALGGLTADDQLAITNAMAATEIAELADRTLTSVSGGQKQRAWLAMVLAQEAEMLFLDEPTNHLDISHALNTLGLVRRLAKDAGKTVLVVLHDLNLAAQFADRIIIMKRGHIAADGLVDKIFSEETISNNFDIQCSVLKRPDNGRPYVLAR